MIATVIVIVSRVGCALQLQQLTNPVPQLLQALDALAQTLHMISKQAHFFIGVCCCRSVLILRGSLIARDVSRVRHNYDWVMS